MLRKIIVILCMLGLLGFSCTLLKKSEPKEVSINNNQEETSALVEEEKLPDRTYTFNIENINTECTEQNEMLCAVEKAVKCTISKDLAECSKLNLPKFIFMTEESIERPTEISYKFINKKMLPNGTVEIYTDSACNGRWFGLCQGTVIYVLAPSSDKNREWYIKDIYAIE